ncbi:S-layer homology domain-containing protein [Cohnella boryungensis]|uniref:S-layer homology domain-containing protein n=1 Tax=Cohnella boryungensis TaxID=768479 RepID=A0ABV8S548_9BACL
MIRKGIVFLLVTVLLAVYYPNQAYAADATLAGGVESVTATNIPSDATDVVLYRGNGAEQDRLQVNVSNSIASSYTFTNVPPGENYYVKSYRYSLPVKSTLEYAYTGSNMISVDPRAVTANGGFGRVPVSDATEGALLTLYQSGGGVIASHTLLSGETAYTFEAVPYGENYYVIQTVNGRSSLNSVFVTSSMPAPSVSGGVGQVAVTNAQDAALLTLFRADGTTAGTEQLAAGQTSHTFTGIAPGLNYYVLQQVGAVGSASSATVTVAPPAIMASGGVGVFHMSGAETGATIRLYRSNGAEEASYTLTGTETSHSFLAVPPGTSYYATQTVNNSEGDGSNTVTVSPEAVSAVGGTREVQASAATGGSVLKLYAEGGGTAVATHVLGALETEYTFSAVAPGLNYFVTQSVAGVESQGSNTVTVTPSPVLLDGGTRAVHVTGAETGATLNLYRSNGELLQTHGLTGSETAYVFTDVPAGSGYYVRQVANGAESAASNTVTVAPSGLQVFGGEQSVAVNGADNGAELKLYQGNGSAVLAQHTLGALETGHTFTVVTPGLNYYVTQTTGGAESQGSNLVSVSPNAPALERGVLSVSVTQAVYEADVILYRADGTELANTTWSLGQSDYTFANVAPGHNYYVEQRLNGVTSRASGLAASLPPAVQAVAGKRSVSVSGFMPGALLTLYDSRNVSVASATPDGATHVFTGLTGGASYIVTQTVNDAESLPSVAVTAESDASSGSNGDSAGTAEKPPVQVGSIDVWFDADRQNRLALGERIQLSGRETLRVMLEESAIARKLTEKTEWRTVTVDVSSENGPVTVEWNGLLAQTLVEHNQSLEIRTGSGTYRLPSSEFRISERIKTGQFSEDMPYEQMIFKVTLAPASQRQSDSFARAASYAGASVLATPMEFRLELQAGDKNVAIEMFGGRVEREIRMPSTADAGEMTTGVVYDERQSVLRHVPTYFYTRDGVTYARISSLTNSLYGVIRHSVKLDEPLPAWASEGVGQMLDRLIMEPERTDDGRTTFAWQSRTSRAEYAASLVRMLGLYRLSADAAFSDVSGLSRYQADIGLAKAYGIVDGYSDGTFRPEQPISRGEALTMLVRALTASGVKSRLKSGQDTLKLESFDDYRDAPAWAREAVSFAVSKGLIQGERNRLQLDRNITRAETAVLLERVLERSELINP